MQKERISFRVDETTHKWLQDLSTVSGLQVSQVVREILVMTRMNSGTRKGYQGCLKYLATLEPSEVLQGIDALIEAIKEVQKDG
ncbi:hypothetical protein NIES4103_27930 [Nostoc sp. NIES-4103]|nr:hypothetical protein NIES4103_27930 [Nostoc sp. NIES-4103]